MTTPTHNGQAAYTPAYRQPATPAPTDFSGIAILKGMMLSLRQQLDAARSDHFKIDKAVFLDNVAGASAHAMGRTKDLTPEQRAQCKTNFETLCKAAPGVMPKAIERLLQAHYMVTAAENDPHNPELVAPLMTFSWVIGMSVGLVRDVDVLAKEKKRKEHAVVSAGGGEKKGAAMRPLYLWVHENMDRYSGVPTRKAGLMAPHVPMDKLPIWMRGQDKPAPERAIKEFLLASKEEQEYKMYGGVKPAGKPKKRAP